MQFSFSDIFRTVVIELGNSGAGKGDASTEINRISKENGINITDVASGTEFRKLFAIYQKAADIGIEKYLNSDILEAVSLSRRGKQVEGIHPIADGVVDRMKVHLRALGQDRKSLFIVDGIPRNSEDFSEITAGKRLPSQILQFAELFRIAIKAVVAEGVFELVPEDAHSLEITAEQDLKEVREDNQGLSKIAKSIREDSNYIIVHVSEETAGVLMTNRSYKELAEMYKKLAEYDGNESEKIDKALEAVQKLVLIQSKSFEVDKGEVVFGKLSSLRLFDPFDETQTEIIDKTVQEICRQGLVDLVGEEALNGLEEFKIIEKFIKTIKTKFDIKSDLRPDDMTEKVRDERNGAYKTKVEENVFDELGIKVEQSPDGLPLLHTEGPAKHVFLVLNEIDRSDPEKGYKHYLGEVSNMGTELFMQLGYLPQLRHERA